MSQRETGQSGWVPASLNELGELHCGQSPATAAVNGTGEGEPYVSGPEQWSEGRVSLSKWTTAAKRIAPANSIFITVKGAGVGKMVLGVRAAIGRDVYAFEPSEHVERKFIFWAIKYGINRIVARAKGDIPGLTKDAILDHDILVPPRSTQVATVERIEALFAEIDKGVESLQAARTALRLYRQSLLKSAFEGRLTTDWRAANPDKLETPDALLARIKDEREAGYKVGLTEWKEACAAWEEDGRRGPKPKKPEKLEPSTPLAAHEMASIPDLPDEWVYCRLSDVAAIGSGMSVSKSRKHEDPIEVSYLRVANVQRGYLNLSDIRSMPVERSQLANLKLRELDVLFNEGGDRDKLGRGWIWDGQIETCITQNHVFRARPYKQNRTWSRFISEWGNSYGRDYFEKGGKQTTNLASINKAVLKALPVPLCTPTEQAGIVRILDERLSAADALDKEIEAGLKRADALRQSILTEAFAGRLVPQDPDDEPAAVLLERIRAAREAKPKATRRRRIKKSEQTEELAL